jgi:hypothetical protein
MLCDKAFYSGLTKFKPPCPEVPKSPSVCRKAPGLIYPHDHIVTSSVNLRLGKIQAAIESDYGPQHCPQDGVLAKAIALNIVDHVLDPGVKQYSA